MRNFGSVKNTASAGGMLSVEKFNHVSSEQYSVEEAEVELAEAQDAAAEVEAAAAELEQAQDVAGSLEDIEGLITEGEPLTEREANLVAVAGDLAYAGTTEPVDPIVPEAAMESYRSGGRLSFENRIVDAIKDIWRYIKQALAKAWKKIKEFYSKYFGPVKKLEKDFEALKKRASGLAGSSKVRDGERTFELTSGVQTLCIDYKAITNGADLLKNGATYGELMRATLSSESANSTRAFLEGINKVISEFDPEDGKAEMAIDTLAGVFENLVKTGIKHLTKTSLQNSGDYEFYKSPSVFGNRAECVRVHKDLLRSNSVFKSVKELETLNKTSFSFREFSDHGNKEKPTECSFTILSGSQMEDLCDQAIEWTRLLQAYATGRAVADMEKERTRLEKATDTLEARFAKYENRSNTSASGSTGMSVALYRQFVALNTVALNVAAGSAVSLQKHALGVMAAYRHIIKASLSRYE